MINSYSSRGFTLLEAIVAMVIVSVLSMSLYSWLNVSYVSSNRAIEALDVTDVVVSARAYIEKINPMAQPDGTYQLGEYYIKWSSTPITDIAPAYNGGSPGLFDIALYQVDVELIKGNVEESKNVVGLYSVELIGYHRAREPFL